MLIMLSTGLVAQSDLPRASDQDSEPLLAGGLTTPRDVRFSSRPVVLETGVPAQQISPMEFFRRGPIGRASWDQLPSTQRPLAASSRGWFCAGPVPRHF